MDNAPYHSRRKEEYPVQCWSNKKMVKLLDAKAILYPDNCLKTDITPLVYASRGLVWVDTCLILPILLFSFIKNCKFLSWSSWACDVINSAGPPGAIITQFYAILSRATRVILEKRLHRLCMEFRVHYYPAVFCVQSKKVLPASTSVAEWYKSHAYIPFLSKVIQVFWAANSAWTRYR